MVETPTRRGVIVVGLGAQAKYALDALSDDPACRIVGLVDLAAEPIISPTLGFEVLGGDDQLEVLLREHAEAAVVCCADSRRKESLFARIRAAAVRIMSVVHSRAVVSDTAELGEGVMINAGAIVQPYARIGDGVMVHATAVIEHDCRVERFANLAPGVKLAGWVRVGAHARLFTGAVVIPSIKIGEGATVGAGATVIRDVEAGACVVGVPARPIFGGGGREVSGDRD